MNVVLDASAVGAFLLPDEKALLGSLAREVCRSERLHVPPIWRAEVANLLLKAFRRGRIDAVELGRAAAEADLVATVALVEAEPGIAVILEGCRAMGLKPYDFTYFDIARRLGVPLLTGDGPLNRAAREAGLRLLLP